MFSLTNNPIDPIQLRKSLSNPAAGACVTFEGIVRNHNDSRKVLSLEYEAYTELCEVQTAKIFKEAHAQFSIIEAQCVHRTGKLNISDMAVWVGVSTAHRDDAFKACRYIIDEIKKRLPIWKKEIYADGDSGWVNGTGSHQNHSQFSPQTYGHRNQS